MTFLFRSPMSLPLAALVLALGGCSSEPMESLPHPHELVAATPGDEVTFGASEERGPYARVTVRRGDEQPGAGGMPGARYSAVYLRYEIIASREMIEVTEERLDSDLYLAFADAGPFTADRCCATSPHQSVAETDALILFHRNGAP